jgi:signal transduction histidine kinase
MIAVGCKNTLMMAISDDGVGFGHAANGKTGTGNGLALHTTMLAIVGGSLVAEAGVSGGTVVTIRLPPAQSRTQMAK